MNISNFSVNHVLKNIEGNYSQVWYHDPSVNGVNGWKYYDAGDNLSTLISLQDFDSVPFWIKINNSNLKEIKIDDEKIN